MAIPDTQTVVTDDPFDAADNAKSRDYEFFGMVVLDPWFGYFAGGGAKPIPFDPAVHPADKRTTIIDAQIIPIAEQNVTNEVKQNFTDFSPDWTKITLPSIKAMGVSGTREINNKFVRVAMVDGKREIVKDGVKTGDHWKTWKFIEIFPDEAACRAAYAGNGHSAPTEQQPAQPPLNGGNGNGASHSPDQETALKFAAIPVKKACLNKSANDLDAIQGELRTVLAGMPMINKHFTADSPEILDLIMQELSK